jgi:outer membrane protein, multidrug efflux system
MHTNVSVKRTIGHLPLFTVLFAALITGGCFTVGPDYKRPELPESGSWNSEMTGGLEAKTLATGSLARWWAGLRDPMLTSLVGRAAAGNHDLKEARAKVREARARRGIAGAGQFPGLDATGSGTRSRGSEKTGGGETRDLYSTGFDASWELDIFGGVRRSVEAAEADLQAENEGLRDVLVSLISEVALNYVEVRTYQARLKVAEENLKAQQEICQLTQARYQAGLTDELAVHQARYNMENTLSQIPNLRTGMEGSKNRLAVLLGIRPGDVHRELAVAGPVPVAPLSMAVGVPADAMRRRPDVRWAERELAAQTARIGVATSDLYPKFTLSGSIGLDALSVGDLFSSGSRTFGFGPRITWSIFDAGAIRGNIEVQSALQEQALIRYESTVLKALEEVENALVAYAGEQRRRNALKEATGAARHAADLANDKYMAGLIDFSDVLDAHRSLLSFQDQLAQSDGAVTSNLITIYKALGGGWESLAPDNSKSDIDKEKPHEKENRPEI